MTSLILCTYNRAASLKQTLESFAQMQVPADLSWELVLVDNNSSDDTRAVAEACAKDCNLPLRYIFEPNQGISFARNAGVRAAHVQAAVCPPPRCRARGCGE
jgi:glycosyltransferase involved in cell wall biosynthesis